MLMLAVIKQVHAMGTPFSVILQVSLLPFIPSASHRSTNSKGILILFGGSNQVEFSNEVYIMNWKAKEWKLIQEGSDGGGVTDEGKRTPQRRNFHTSIIHHNPE